MNSSNADNLILNENLTNSVTITVGNGNGDVVNAEQSEGDTITVGDGAATQSPSATATVIR
jgi:hypothetical protein